MINERGTKKWTSIMLPEQIEMLEQLDREQDRKEKPILDEQQIDENSFKLKGALEYKLEVKITYFVDHEFKSTEGSVKNISNNMIYIEVTVINIDDIIGVEFLNPLM